MGGRGGASAVNRERMLSDFNALMREQGQLGPQQQVQRAIRDIMRDTGATTWVDIADVRERLSMSRADFDRLILDMSFGPNRVLTVIPEENQRTLTPRRRAAAIHVGGDVVDLVRIGG